MSPLCVEILLWHYGCLSQYPYWERGTAQRHVRAWLLENSLLDGELGNYAITDKGRALVEAICATPMPVQRWVAA